MKGDFTRRTFDSRNHYDGVLLQQGRVQLDADWNEQVDIAAHRARTTTGDVIGVHGGPLGAAGMAITLADGSRPVSAAPGALRVSAGRYYVAGTLCESDAAVPLEGQPDLPGVALPTAAGRYVAYLDVWREHVTALERPALREVALGGPDTATRTRTVWQVRLAPVGATATCADVAPPWAPPDSESTARLRARAQAPGAAASPCVIPATAGYRRLENQLYRVEVHDGTGAAGGPTYVWSRDNGTVAARLVRLDGDELTIAAPGRDDRTSFAKDQWVEVVDAGRSRRGERGFLGRLDDAVGTGLTVGEWRGGTGPTAADLPDLARTVVLVRRWDSDGALPVPTAAGWVDLEGGVQVEFEPGATYRTGDHWLVPARTADLQGQPADLDLAGDVDWPVEGGVPQFRRRAGVDHAYAAVALLDLAGGSWTRVSDCRPLFPPVTELVDVEGGGGDGQVVMPGESLSQPLLVTVSNGTAPLAGARVRYTAADADGRLAATAGGLPGTAATVDVDTDADGVARCFWRPAADGARPRQVVTARLLGPGGQPRGAPVAFTAGLSLASRVAFDPRSCTALAGTDTVQEAIDRLLAARSLVAVGGDGQAAPAGGVLAHPVEVLVRSDCGPVAGASVEVAVDSGAVARDAAGLGANAVAVKLTTDGDGLARAFWRLGPTVPVQVLTAVLTDGPVLGTPTRHRFTATLENPGGQKPGLHVVGTMVGPGDRPLLNDSVEGLDGGVLKGIAVVLDGAPDRALVDGKPVLRVTVGVPHPLAAGSAGTIAGTWPLRLDGPVRAGKAGDKPAVIWQPGPAVGAFLKNLLETVDPLLEGHPLLCEVVLSGRAVAAVDEPDLLVNGLAVPRPGGGGELALPSTDDVRGDDFRLWFWLVRETLLLVLWPTVEGVFRLKSGRDALTRALSGPDLRRRLPRRIGVTLGPPDLDLARRSAGRAFLNRPVRRVALVVDERYAEAGEEVTAALARIEVEVETVVDADPFAAARARLDAGEPVDGVLADSTAAEAAAAAGGFGDPVSL
jgi:hypothetical protein